MSYSIPCNNLWTAAHCAISSSLFVPRKTWLSPLFPFQWVLRIMSSSTHVVIIVVVVFYPLPVFVFPHIVYFSVVNSHLILLKQLQPNPIHLFSPWGVPHHSANYSLVWFLLLSKYIIVPPNLQLPTTSNFLIIFTRCYLHQQARIASYLGH